MGDIYFGYFLGEVLGLAKIIVVGIIFTFSGSGKNIGVLFLNMFFIYLLNNWVWISCVICLDVLCFKLSTVS